MTHAMTPTVAHALIKSFKEAVAGGIGKPFEQTGVAVPSYSVFYRYAEAGVRAMADPSQEVLQAAYGHLYRLDTTRGREQAILSWQRGMSAALGEEVA